jgi:uncharacterized membrane protein
MPAIRLAELHPIIVHFPIALLIASVALDFAGIAVRRAGLTQAATWCLVLGVPGALAALASGWLSERDVNLALAGSLLHLHKVAAVFTSVLFGTLLVIRIGWLLPDLLAWLAQVFPQLAPAVAGLEPQLRRMLPLLYVKRLPRSLVATYLAVSVLGVIMLGITGYLGGAMVYDRGVGLPVP